LQIHSKEPFKGDIDIDKLKAVFAEYGADKSCLCSHGSLNQPDRRPAIFDAKHARCSKKVCDDNGTMMVLDASLIGENAYMIKQREPEFANA
jgi:tyrosine phenol-lyase